MRLVCATRVEMAREFQPLGERADDLGSRPVTVSVGELTTSDRAKALDRGLAYAQELVARELIEGAALFLQDDVRLTGFPTLNSAELTHV